MTAHFVSALHMSEPLVPSMMRLRQLLCPARTRIDFLLERHYRDQSCERDTRNIHGPRIRGRRRRHTERKENSEVAFG